LPGTDIFLSYARHDRGTARIFAECLIDEGFTVWWDASLHSGETFDEVIERNLREARAVVVLWSPASVASRWVRAEATLADRRDKLAPVIIEPCDLPIIFELKHAADLSDWTGDMTDARWQRFVEDVQALVAADGQGHAVAHGHSARPKAPVQKAEPPSRAQPSGRRPLRPGNDEVILAHRGHRRPAAAGEASPPGEVHFLHVEDSALAADPIPVESSGVRIGRKAPADIVLSHPSISREHCIVGLANDELLVSDLNSTNGTYIDDVRISRATVLPVGSVLRLGEISLRHAVRSGPEAEQAASGSRAERFAATS
jgi:hypothetical protein